MKKTAAVVLCAAMMLTACGGASTTETTAAGSQAAGSEAVSYTHLQNKALKSLLVTVLLFGGIICTVYPFQQCCSTSSTTNGQGKARCV